MAQLRLPTTDKNFTAELTRFIHSGWRGKTVTLTAAQIITLHSVPVQLVEAPPAGYAHVVEWMLLSMTTTATGFTGGGVVAPVYHGATAALTANTVPAAVVTAVAGTSYTFLSVGAPTSGVTLTAAAAIDLYAASADFAAGTGTAIVQLGYRTVPLAPQN